MSSAALIQSGTFEPPQTIIEHGEECKMRPKLDITINLPQFARLQRLRLDPQKEA